jgi:quercetin 2,3-dioxygenase
MITLRRSEERGHANHGWLDSYHSFSFSRYYDPNHMQYSVLRVINEDVIAPDMGFGMHPHHDMEIVTYMLSGELRHMDSLGNGSVMQIWLLPERNDITPGYEEKHFAEEEKRNQWRVVASRDARDGSLLIHQDITLYATVLQEGQSLSYDLPAGRSAYLQVARGHVDLNGEMLLAGDAAKIDQQQLIELRAIEEAEMLLFDLPLANEI